MTPLSSVAMLRWLVWRDVLLAWRRRSDVLGGLFFFVLVVSLFPLSVGPERELLRATGGGVVWVSALLASMLSMPRLFGDDYGDGTLEQLMVSPLPLPLVVAGKVFAQWLVSCVPLLLVAPVMAMQFGLPREVPRVLVLSLAVGTPIILLYGAIGAALTLGLRGAGSLISLLVMPLCVPVLVFGTGAMHALDGGAAANLRLLAAFLLLTATFAPWAVAAALEVSVE